MSQAGRPRARVTLVGIDVDADGCALYVLTWRNDLLRNLGRKCWCVLRRSYLNRVWRPASVEVMPQRAALVSGLMLRVRARNIVWSCLVKSDRSVTFDAALCQLWIGSYRINRHDPPSSVEPDLTFAVRSHIVT